MSFLAPRVDVSNGDTSPMAYDISGPVPAVFGRARIPLRLIESPFNHEVFDHGKTRPKGNVYSLVLAGCWGPVSRLFNLYINGTPLNVTADADGDYHDDEFGSWAGPSDNRDHSKVRIYWGTDTQSPDDFLNGVARHGFQPPRNPDEHPRTHPAYIGLFYVIFHNLHLDDGAGSIAGTANIPPIEAEVFVPGAFGDNHHDHGVNPIAIAHAWLTNPVWGAALPLALVPSSAWETAAVGLSASLGDHPWRAMCSPQLTSTQELAAPLAKLFGFFDGHAQVRNGSVEAGWVERQPAAWGGATEITRHDLLAEPDIDPGGWEDTLTEVSVKARNVFERLSETSLTERSTYVRDVRGTDARETVDGDWLIHPAQQRIHALRVLSDRSQPPFRARLKLPRSFRHADGSLILPGDLVHLDYAPYQLDLVCRVIEREDRKGEVLLTVDRAAGAFPEEYVPAEDTRTLPLAEPPEPITLARAYELPDGLSPPWPPQVAVLAARPHASTVAAEVWISGTGAWAGEEQQLAALAAFVDSVTLVEAIDAQSAQVRFQLGAVRDFVLNRSFTEAEQRSGEALLLVGDELISLGAMDADATVPPVYTYAVNRGVFDSVATAHASGQQAFLFSRDTLDRLTFEHALFQWESPYAANAACTWFRLRAYTVFGMADVSEDTQLVLRDRTPAAPAFAAITPERGGVHIQWQPQLRGITEVRILREAVSQDGNPLFGPFLFKVIASVPAGALSYTDRSPNLGNYGYLYALQAVDVAGRVSPIDHPDPLSGHGPTLRPIPPQPHTNIMFRGWRRQVSNIGTDTLIFAQPHNLSGGDALILRSTGSLPDGLSEDTTYFALPTGDNSTQLLDDNGDAVLFTHAGASGTVTLFKREVVATWLPSPDPFLLKTVIGYYNERSAQAPANLLAAPTAPTVTIADWYPVTIGGGYDFDVTLVLWDSFGQPHLSIHTIQNT